MNSFLRLHVTAFCLILTTLALSSALSTHAYPVGPAKSLDEMTAMADLVVKATVISSTKANGATNRDIPGYAIFETKLRVISTIKGDPGGSIITFRHYSEYNMTGISYSPQHYEFTKGKSYIVFAKRTDAPALFESLSWNHTMKGDDGVFRAPNDAPLAAKSVKDACWQDLTECCRAANADIAVYGLNQLDWMSGGWGSVAFMGLNDFPRDRVIEVVRPMLTGSDDKILQAAINVAGSHGPYMSLGDIEFWLASLHGHLSGLGPREFNMTNSAGQSLWRELAAVADGHAAPETRALAISALGRTHEPELKPLAEKWLADSNPQVCGAAVLLLADYPGERTTQFIEKSTKDSRPDVRLHAAVAAAFAGSPTLAPRLVEMMSDADEKVREDAVLGLLAFPNLDEGILRQCSKDPEYGCLFVNILAASNPALYLGSLQDTVVKQSNPRAWWGGSIPSVISWNILFKYVQSQPPAEIQSGKFDSSLDALEKMHWYSSSTPRDLYAYYLQRKLDSRAAAFREASLKDHPDYQQYFDQAAQNPGLYLGN